MRGAGLLLAAASTAAGCLYDGRPFDGADAAIPDADPAARIAENLIGLWTIDENGGTTVTDSTGIQPPVVLTIADTTKMSWSPGQLTVNEPVDINTGFGTNNRLVPPCRESDQVTLEAWVSSGNITQTGITTAGQPARVISLTVQNIGGHSISIGQLGETWSGQVRTTATGIDAHGGPMLTNGLVTTDLTHLVLTSTPTERAFYVDGVAVTDAFGGLLDRWEPMRTLAIAGDPGRRNPWLGTIHLLAMYDRALAPTEVTQNFRAGP
jgi:hypothetical protein